MLIRAQHDAKSKKTDAKHCILNDPTYIEKAKPKGQQTDQWFPGSGSGGGD